jgi:hypothetical protein
MSIDDIVTNNYEEADYEDIAGSLNPGFGLKVKPILTKFKTKNISD